MVDLNNIRQVYFIGIGGIGMSALARYFDHAGITVAGYDKTPSPLSRELEREGFRISYDDDPDTIPMEFMDPREKEHRMIVFTPAIPHDHRIRQWFSGQGYSLYKRSEVLGMITAAGRTLGVAGTHGKTTVSSLLAHILKQSAVDCTAFLGGIALNYRSNLLTGASKIVVAEADEYDRSFHRLTVEKGLITAVDPDHLDIYGTYDHLKEAFLHYAREVKQELVVHKNLLSLFRENTSKTPLTYGLDGPADYYTENRRLEDGMYYFDLVFPGGTIRDIRFSWPGLINIENATGASALALLAGAQPEEIKKALLLFRGVYRRFEKVVERGKLIYMDDYAHHPREIEVVLQTLRERYPGRRITAVFQPHLYSRTRDFADGFAEALSAADEVVLIPIYPAREKPIEGVNSKLIYDKLLINEKHLMEKDQVLDFLEQKPLEILITLGAGDIDRLVPLIREQLTKK